MSDSSEDFGEEAPADPIEPEELVGELRRLRARIPRYKQLTIREAQSMVRVAHLHPEFVDAGINATDASEVASHLLGRERFGRIEFNRLPAQQPNPSTLGCGRTTSEELH